MRAIQFFIILTSSAQSPIFRPGVSSFRLNQLATCDMGQQFSDLQIFKMTGNRIHDPLNQSRGPCPSTSRIPLAYPSSI